MRGGGEPGDGAISRPRLTTIIEKPTRPHGVHEVALNSMFYDLRYPWACMQVQTALLLTAFLISSYVELKSMISREPKYQSTGRERGCNVTNIFSVICP